MIHQPSGGAQGQATDIEIHAREILKTREQLNKILRRAHRPASGQDPGRHGAIYSCRAPEAKATA